MGQVVEVSYQESELFQEATSAPPWTSAAWNGAGHHRFSTANWTTKGCGVSRNRQPEIGKKWCVPTDQFPVSNFQFPMNLYSYTILMIALSCRVCGWKICTSWGGGQTCIAAGRDLGHHPGANDGVYVGICRRPLRDLLSAAFGLWTLSLTAVGFLAGQPWVHALGPTVIRLALSSLWEL
jgi:hypothetical protein